MPNMTDRFDPDNVTKETMREIYNSLSLFVEDIAKKIMVPPEDMSPKEWQKMKDGIEVAEKLLKRLKKNDTSVFVLDP